MIIEITARFKKSKTEVEIEEEKETIKVNKLIYGDDYSVPPSKEKYDYELTSIDIKDIRIFNPVDEEHTCIRTFFGDTWVCKAPYEKFKAFYEKVTKQTVLSYESFQI